MIGRRRPRRRGPQLPIPKHPFRDSALVNAVLSALLLVVAWLTGGSLLRALVYALAFFVIATGWNWWRFRQRLAEDAEKPQSGRR